MYAILFNRDHPILKTDARAAGVKGREGHWQANPSFASPMASQTLWGSYRTRSKTHRTMNPDHLRHVVCTVLHSSDKCVHTLLPWAGVSLGRTRACWKFQGRSTQQLSVSLRGASLTLLEWGRQYPLPMYCLPASCLAPVPYHTVVSSETTDNRNYTIAPTRKLGHLLLYLATGSLQT